MVRVSTFYVALFGQNNISTLASLLENQSEYECILQRPLLPVSGCLAAFDCRIPHVCN